MINVRHPSRVLLPVALAFVLAGAGTAPQVDDPEWPRFVDVPEGRVVMYQPEPESFEADRIHARAAVSVTRTGASEPVFGVVWVDARVETDRDERTVAVLDVDVERVRFPNANEAQQDTLASILETHVPGWELVFSLDRLLASLAILDRDRGIAEELSSDPPEILFRSTPAVLVSIDGDPITESVEGTGVSRVVNTPYTLLRSSEGPYYLFASGERWYTAAALDGSWSVASAVPSTIAGMAPEIPPEAEGEPADQPTGAAPAIIVTTEPAELIVTDGEPEFVSVPQTDLLYVTNSESDILMHVATQRYLVVLSGRWYAATLLEGPWAHVAPEDLPATMTSIPADAPMGYLRVSIPGTEEAEDAVLEQQIPQTAAIQRDEASLEVSYDGDPWFEPIDGTSMEYAINTDVSVVRVGARYYAVDGGVWFVADAATGPWLVADEVPEEIYSIPPNVPVHNVKYVRIYDSTPDVVYVGYYPGYTHSYVYGGTVVYGTGYYYNPWYGSVYYPRPATWGWHVRYNPYYGWSYGFSYSTGPFTFGIGWGGGYPGYHGWWGPVGYRGYHSGYHRGWHDGYRAGAGAGYRAGFRAGRELDAGRNNIYDRSRNRGRVADRPVGNRATRPSIATGASNDVFTDRNGDVFRRNEGNWERRSGQEWSRPSGSSRPGAAIGSGSGVPNRDQLNRSYQSRNRGASRAGSFQRGRSPARGGRRR